jgi:hypothetical protein
MNKHLAWGLALALGLVGRAVWAGDLVVGPITRMSGEVQELSPAREAAPSDPGPLRVFSPGTLSKSSPAAVSGQRMLPPAVPLRSPAPGALKRSDSTAVPPGMAPPAPATTPTPPGPAAGSATTPGPDQAPMFGPVQGPVCSDCSGCCEGLFCPGKCCLGGNFVYGSAEYLLWFFKRDDAPPLVTNATTLVGTPGALGNPGTVILFAGNDLATGVHNGARFTGGIWLFEDLGVEGSFFFLPSRGVHFFAGSDGVPTLYRPFFRVNPIALPGGGVIPAGEDAEIVAEPGVLRGQVTVDTASKLWGAEANLRKRLCCHPWYRFEVLGGFRYLNLEERLSIEEGLTIPSGPGAGNTFFVKDRFLTDNNFYGGQIGALAEVKLLMFVLGVNAKVAFGAIDQDVEVQGFTQFNGGPAQPGGLLALPTNIGRRSDTRFAVIPEVGVNLGLQLGPNLRVFTGYNFLAISSVVRPGEQIDRVINTTQLPSPTGPNPVVGEPRPRPLFERDSFWAQGINFGLMVSF